MNSLHIVAKAPSAASLADLRAVIDDGDVLIFIEDGVYFARSEFPNRPAAGQATQSAPYFSHLECYYLAEDLAARGIEPHDEMQVVDTEGFVALSARLARSVSWY